MYNAIVRLRMQALKDRINETVHDKKTRQSILREIEAEFSNLLSTSVYFPLARHGDYVAIGRKYIGDTEDHSERVVCYADTEAQAKALGKEKGPLRLQSSPVRCSPFGLHAACGFRLHP